MNHPTGTVTFLFTDIEGSTRLWQEHSDQMKVNLARHDALLRQAIERNEGCVFKTVGDAFCAAFQTAAQGVKAALESQQALAKENWGEALIKVRMGLHTGDAEERDNDYFGNTVNRVARLMSAGHGGQILISLATQELMRDKLPEGVSLVDLGERRLKDLIRPERIYQLNMEGLRDSFPALKTLDAYRHNLPAQTTSFIGREKEITDIKHAISEHRLVTLAGPGGTGKTRLSLQVAADLLDQFPNGVWFAELAPVTDPGLIPQTILAAADIQIQQGRNALDSLLDFLREKTSLVVLDNCEHLVDACAKLADTLLASSANLKILASSREALGVKGEMAWRVPSLSIPDLKHLPPLEQLLQYEAVQLFIERARLVQQNFAANNDNAPAVAQICSRLDGIPLAIELAASRIRMMSAEQISARLDDRFRLLTGGSRTALPRQQTLRSLIDWSYDLLSENEKLLLRRLAVFIGGWTLEAAEQVCSDGQIHADDILDLLAHLVDKSLIALDEQSAQSRYRILETIRQYAREKLLDTGEGEKLRIRHLTYFLDLVEASVLHFFRAEQIEWLDKLERDHDNLLAALEWALERAQGDPPEAALRLVGALRSFWLMRGYWVEAKEWSARALEIPGQSKDTLNWARALFCVESFKDEYEKSVEAFDECIALFRMFDDQTGLADALLFKGMFVRNNLDWTSGQSLIAESLNLFRAAKDERGAARALYQLGWCAYRERDLTSTRRYFEESLKLSRGLGDRRFAAVALMSLGSIAMDQGDYDAARWFCEESLSLGRELNDKHGISMYLKSLARMEQGLGNYRVAEQLSEESLVLTKELGSRYDVSYALLDIGRVARFQGNYEKAKECYSESLALFRAINEKPGIALSLWGMGVLARIQSDFESANLFLGESLSIAKELKDQEIAVYVLEEFAALSAAQGQAKHAAILFGAAEAMREHIHIVLLPIEKTEVDKNVAVARMQLDEAAFNAAWAEGRTMTMEQAIVHALEETA